VTKNPKARSFNKTTRFNFLDNDEVILNNKIIDTMIYGYSTIFPQIANQVLETSNTNLLYKETGKAMGYLKSRKKKA